MARLQLDLEQVISQEALKDVGSQSRSPRMDGAPAYTFPLGAVPQAPMRVFGRVRSVLKILLYSPPLFFDKY